MRSRWFLAGLLLGAVFGVILGAVVAAALQFSGSAAAAQMAGATLIAWFTAVGAVIGAWTGARWPRS
jgi:hypothetical protein